MRPRRMPIWHYCCYALTLLMSLYSFLPGSLAVPMLDNKNSALAINSSTSIPAAASTLPFKYTDLSTTTASNTSTQARGIEGSSPADFKTSINHNDTKRVISPNIFIAGWEVVCPTPNWILRNMDLNPSSYPKFRISAQMNYADGRSRPHLINDVSELDTMGNTAKNSLLHRVRMYGTKCRTCICDPETGEMKPAGAPNRAVRSYLWCWRGTESPEACRSWWIEDLQKNTASSIVHTKDCYCKVTAGQPLPIQGESYQAHLDALERVPQVFRDQLPDYEWAPPGTAINARPTWLQEAPPPFAPLPELEPGASAGLRPATSPELGPALEEPPELVDMDQLERLLLDTGAVPYARQPTTEEPGGEPNGEPDGESIIESSAGPSRGPLLYRAHDRQGWRRPRRYYDPVRDFGRPAGGSAPPPLLRRRDHSLKEREISMPNQVGNAQMDETTKAQ
ncbi:hypothetical protein TWF706_003843 [Orbilia oligospora]|nr:hypothetical protein TWF706_003843 [Orbilia oligospora]KAF3116166.1 hypothetical protein TWF103_009393 [Orbilia oligospora]